MIYCGARNDPEIWPLRAILNILLKVAQIDMNIKTDAKPVENFRENEQRPEFILILGPKWHLRPIFSTHLKVLATSMWSNTQMKPVKRFLKKRTYIRILTDVGTPKWPRIWASEAHVVHISESSSNEHIKQDYCEPRATFWTKYSKTWILPYLEAQNFCPPGPIFYTPTK